MTQENGVPIEFELIDKKTGEVASNDLWTIDFVTGKLVYNEFFYALRQAIGATDSSDPKQELYVGDLIEFEYAGRIIGEIVWKDWEVLVKYRPFGEAGIGKRGCVYLGFKTVFEYRFGEKRQSIKKLGSRYDPKMKEVLKKAGLE